MTSEEKLIEVLKGNLITEELKIKGVIQGVVMEVGVTTCKVRLTSNDLEITDVQYTATEDNDQGVIIVPKKGANVLIGLIGNDENSLYIVRVDEVEEINVTIDDTTVKINKDNIVINEGDNGGLVISEATANQINSIKTDINNFKNLLSSWVPIPQDGGLELKTLVSSWTAEPYSLTNKIDLENDKILH